MDFLALHLRRQQTSWSLPDSLRSHHGGSVTQSPVTLPTEPTPRHHVAKPMNSVKSPSDVQGLALFVKKESSRHFQQHYDPLRRYSISGKANYKGQTPTFKIKAGSQAVSFTNSISSHPEISSSISRHVLPTTCPRRTAW
jgi:hypothetical protein